MQSLKLQATGVLLFLFIPVVLFLFVRHPEPVGASLVGGIVLMLGHRFLARPYMERALAAKCVWCNRVPPAGEEILELRSAAQDARVVQARGCTGHREPAARYFSFVSAWRWPMRIGIFVPLLILLGSLAAAALGREVDLEGATALFRLAVGVTVNLAAIGYLFRKPTVPGTDRAPIEVPFPLHNFFLLGLHNLIWVFRLVGAWWIWQGLGYFLHL